MLINDPIISLLTDWSINRKVIFKKTNILSDKNSCTKCGENMSVNKYRCNKYIGYCEECAKLLEIGHNKDYISILENEHEKFPEFPHPD